MIIHNSRSYDDSPQKPYELTRRLVTNHIEDECEIFLVYGSPEGVGKSAYVHHVLADLHGYYKCKEQKLVDAMWVKREEAAALPKWESDWEKIKGYIYYPPTEVVNKCLHMLDNEIVDVAFHWDDAGKWLYFMEFNDPFVIAFLEYITLARTNWKGGIILSTPFKEWVLKKMLNTEGILQIKIHKPPGTDYRYIWKPRIATCYRKTRYPGAPRSFFPRVFEDHFSAIMPDSFFDWYEPQRNKYAKIAGRHMQLALLKRKAKGLDVSDVEQVLAEMQDEIANANESAPELLEAIAQVEPQKAVS